MNIPVIADIDGFAEMYDLLRNQPELQKRLDNLKTVQDYVNQRIGTLDQVQDIRAKQTEANQLLTDAQYAKATADEEAAQLRAKMDKEYDDHKALITAGVADHRRRMERVDVRETAVVLRENSAAKREADQNDRESVLAAFDKRVNDGSVALQQRSYEIEEKLAKMKAIWNG